MPVRQGFYKLLQIILVLAAIGLAVVWYEFVGKRERNLTNVSPQVLEQRNRDEIGLLVVASGLDTPWSLDFLPDGRMLVTERPGRIRVIDPIAGLLPKPVLKVEVTPQGEGGLLGLAVHPEFADNQRIFLYHTYTRGRELVNRVVSYTFADNTLSRPQIIIDRIPGAPFHNGGRIKFGPDGLLYITTGDAQVPETAQDLTSLAGKILRLQDDGSIPPDNPFADSPVFSYGHRNPQGLAWDDDGRLWATEHGPSGLDEINLIEPGNNYGWPLIQGDDEAPGMVAPVLHSGNGTWAPSGAAALGGSLYFTGLRGRALYRFNLDRDPVLLTHLANRFGRLRDVVPAPQGLLYILTSNRDGRGIATAEDDLLLAVNPDRL